ncbi:LysM peptidoglycan-binding domain-containing protein [Alteribacillus sp. HJP-4]|uniref:LysM peptidoglycan-binding domain-containing protein n=1 Tax=Alteribacillus sp. HJP-4 TaxID=2775394 RepID=UPI0035CCC968
MPITKGSYFIYTVQPDDTLYSIARQLGSNAPAISQINSLYPPFSDPGVIYRNARIIVPYPYNPKSQVFYFIQPGDTLQSIGRSLGVSVNSIQKVNPELEDPNMLQPYDLIQIPLRMYAVNTGDSLNSISQQLGVNVQNIVNANQSRQGFSPDVITPGYGLLVP